MCVNGWLIIGADAYALKVCSCTVSLYDSITLDYMVHPLISLVPTLSSTCSLTFSELTIPPSLLSVTWLFPPIVSHLSSVYPSPTAPCLTPSTLFLRAMLHLHCQSWCRVLTRCQQFLPTHSTPSTNTLTSSHSLSFSLAYPLPSPPNLLSTSFS